MFSGLGRIVRVVLWAAVAVGSTGAWAWACAVRQRESAVCWLQGLPFRIFLRYGRGGPGQLAQSVLSAADTVGLSRGWAAVLGQPLPAAWVPMGVDSSWVFAANERLGLPAVEPTLTLRGRSSRAEGVCERNWGGWLLAGCRPAVRCAALQGSPSSETGQRK